MLTLAGRVCHRSFNGLADLSRGRDVVPVSMRFARRLLRQVFLYLPGVRVAKSKRHGAKRNRRRARCWAAAGRRPGQAMSLQGILLIDALTSW